MEGKMTEEMAGKRKDYDPSTGVTWGERHQDVLEKIWGKVPSPIAKYLVSMIVFLLGCTVSGEWLLIFAHWTKYTSPGRNATGMELEDPLLPDDDRSFVERFDLQGFAKIAFFANLAGFGAYFGIGGFLHWYFYFRRRETPHEWKCQPNRWLSPELERHEIKWGSVTLLVTNFISALVAAHVINGGWSMVYYRLDEYGWLWFFLSWPAVFLSQDYMIYWNHRLFHMPFFYKNFHKLHHSYKQPTAFSVTAIHPVECLFFQTLYMLPMFTIPVHWAVYCTILGYIYYHGILDHSGIKLKSMWPWQPDTTFHDNHHQYFHVNYGFNFFMWDVWHGTSRQKDRIYREEIWSQKGISLDEAPKEWLEEEMQERAAENRDDKQELTDALKSKLS